MKFSKLNIEETKLVAKNFVQELMPMSGGATVLAFEGELGSGKTAFTQELGKILGVSEHMQSPTFVIEKIYELVDKPWQHLIHIDAYRLKNEEELTVLGWDNLIKNERNLIVVEWASKVKNILPNSAIHIVFTHDGEDQRTIEIKDQG